MSSTSLTSEDSEIIIDKETGLFLKSTSTDELKEAYEKLRIDVFCKTGDRPPEMERISHELGIRGVKEWQIIKNSNLLENNS